jgi:hypothetical protein
MSRLPGGLENRPPNVAFRVDPAAVTDHDAERDVNKCIVPAANQHIRLSSHSCMDRVLGKIEQ